MVPMTQRRFLALWGLVSLFLVYSCSDGSSPVGQAPAGSAVVALNTVFPQGTTADQTQDITRIRITIKRLSDDSIVQVCVEEVDPNLDVWVISCEVEMVDGLLYILSELIAVENGFEVTLFSGITQDFTLTVSTTSVQEVTVVPGLPANLFVTAVTGVAIDPVTESDGLQLQARVQTNQPATPTLMWESADPSIATVTDGGFLQALQPGTTDVTVIAGGHQDHINVVVLARPTGLAFFSQPGSMEAGESLDPAPSVEVVDVRRDRVASYGGPVTVELQDHTAAVVAAAAPGVVAAAAPGVVAAAAPGVVAAAAPGVVAAAAPGVVAAAAPGVVGAAAPGVVGAAAPGVVGAPQTADLSGTTTVDAVEGLATFEGLVIPEGGLYRLLATAQGLNPAASEDFEVTLPTADIAVSKEVDRPTALEGDQVTFTVTVVNNGPATATGVTVSDRQPAGLLFETVTPSRGSYSAATGAWDLGTLTNGESATLSIDATVGEGTGGETLENVASAAQLTEQGDDPENNEAFAFVDVGRRVADIVVTKKADRAEAIESEEVVFTISVLNVGPDRADQIVVTEHLPDGFQLVSADAGFDRNSGEWTIRSLAPGSLTRLTVTAVVVKGFAGETLTNTATASQLEHQVDDPSNNSGSATIFALPEGARTAALTGTVTDDSETDIQAGGSTIELTLTHDTWVAGGATFDGQRQAIIDGLTSARGETNQWNARVKPSLAVTDVVRTSATLVTITLPAVATYDITANETITATIPAAALVQSGTGIMAAPTFQVTVAAGTVALTGTVTDDSETDIRAGGSTILLTLTDDTWVTAFNPQRQAIIDGLTSAQGETNGWNARVKPALAVTDVVRTSATLVTITLPAVATYDITAAETITATIPAAALVQSGTGIMAAPTFQVTVAAGDRGVDGDGRQRDGHPGGRIDHPSDVDG